ncbi:HD domain-containing phosphohydrolase [Methylobacter tundripaludum]|uniref:Response regulator receiver protein n=1 Tax=Methylobacter tundripaludum (strain ATCC BAA-1195 / DSM 17260 / SV96) TaxID=697282 RepID=G3IYB0_METTV|nr:HD domain-containing phosphohydrolase [Methylobacter tundripaludum]EGW20032.1 response regulator receiver protein [Methylobacter tundripaludum SV96]
MLIAPASDAPDKSAAILFVDDEANVLKALRRLFHNEPYTAYFASSGAEGLEILRQNAVDLIISDMRMPEMSGAEFLAQVFMQWPETIRILLTGYADFQSTIDAVNKGRIYNYCNKPWNDEELKLLVRNALEQKHLREERDRLSGIVLQQNTELKELNEHLEEKVEQRTEQLKNTMQHLDRANNNLKKQYIDSIKAFSRIIEMRPGIKSGQSKYIAEKSLLVARKLDMNTEEKQNIFYAGLLIQIGKMSLQDSLLAEPYYSIPLIDIRRYLKHAVEGEALLKGLTQLKGASILIRHQYERYDGSGFPDGLAKQKIPLGSRILNVVGDYIAYLEGSMTGEAMSVSATINQLMSRKESYYDPDVIDTFIKVLKEDTSIEEDVVVEPPTVKKSWKNSKLFNGSQNTTVERPVMEISWMQLKPGMEVESVHFENKPYIKNCIIDQKIINNINSLRENTGKNPVIKIRMGKK